MATNKAAVDHLNNNGWSDSDFVVEDLIEGGFLEADPEPELTEPELIAQAAKDWIGKIGSNGNAFSYASGWSTCSWKVVLEDKLAVNEFNLENDIPRLKNIFAALVILAKEAGEEL